MWLPNLNMSPEPKHAWDVHFTQSLTFYILAHALHALCILLENENKFYVCYLSIIKKKVINIYFF